MWKEHDLDINRFNNHMGGVSFEERETNITQVIIKTININMGVVTFFGVLCNKQSLLCDLLLRMCECACTRSGGPIIVL